MKIKKYLSKLIPILFISGSIVSTSVILVSCSSNNNQVSSNEQPKPNKPSGGGSGGGSSGGGSSGGSGGGSIGGGSSGGGSSGGSGGGSSGGNVGVGSGKPPIDKPVQPPANNNLLDENSSGSINGWNIPKYYNLIKELNIFNQDINLSSINDNVLLEKLNNLSDVKDVNLTIKSGNEKQGYITLLLSIGNNSKEINITKNQDYSQNNEFLIQNPSNILINKSIWFDKALPLEKVQESNQIPLEAIDFNSIDIQVHNKTYPYNELIKNDYEIVDFKLEPTIEQNKLKVLFSLKYYLKEYNEASHMWQKISNSEHVILKQKDINIMVDVPTTNDLLKYVIDITSWNENNKNMNNYSSYYFGLAKHFEDNGGIINNITNVTQNIDLYSNKNNQYKQVLKGWKPSVNVVSANDLTGKLLFNVHLKKANVIDEIISNDIELTFNKKLSKENLINQRNDLQLNTNGNIYRNFIKSHEHQINDVRNNYQINQKLEIKNTEVNSSLKSQLSQKIGNLISEQKDDMQIQEIKNNISNFTILGVDILSNYGISEINNDQNNFNCKNNLLTDNTNHDSYFIKSIYLEFSNMSIVLTKENNGVLVEFNNINAIGEFCGFNIDNLNFKIYFKI